MASGYDIKSLNDLFKETYSGMFREDITVADTPITRKLYPKAEKLENGELKIGERSVLPESGPLVGSGIGKSVYGKWRSTQMPQYGAVSLPKLSEGIDEGEDKE